MTTANLNKNSAPSPSPSPLLASLHRDGFVIFRSILTSSELASLRTAADHATRAAQAGTWPFIRTVGKQFPPWPSVPGRDGIWGVQHLLHPGLPVTPADRAAFLHLYFSPAVLGPAKQLMSTPSGPGGTVSSAAADDDLVMELCNLLVRPPTDFSLRWHRDDIPPSATDDEEFARLAEPAWHAQWNLALFEDDSLVVIPGSNARARTSAERAAGPYEEGLPGETRVRLAPGDIVFYDNNILHRGVYDARRERLTLHGSVGHVRGGGTRARNVLQHGVREWIGALTFEALEEGQQRRMAEGMRDRLVRLAGEHADVGFSQDDGFEAREEDGLTDRSAVDRPLFTGKTHAVVASTE